MERGNQPESVAQLLASDHAHLEQLFQAVIACLRGGDPERLRVRWLELDYALELHLNLEEAQLLPRFARAFPTSAARLQREHREIRSALVQLGVDLDLHELCAASATRFISALRAHAAYEDAVLYPWAEAHLAEAERVSVIAGLRHLRATYAAAKRLEGSRHP